MNHKILFILILAFLPFVSQATFVNNHSGVPLKQAIEDARAVAERDHSWHVMLGDGVSMSPYYGSGTVLLVDRAPFRDLQPGMMVVFRDGSGDLVGHWLVGQENGQWITQGVNNATPDRQPLSQGNYEGVIFGVLRSKGADAKGLAHAAKLGLPRVIGKSLR